MTEKSPQSFRYTCIRLGMVVLLLIMSLWAYQAYHDGTLTMLQNRLQSCVNEHPWLSGGAFMLSYALATVLMLPGTLLTLAGGFIFGLWYGFILNWCGAVLGAVLSFLMARLLCGPWLLRRAHGRAALIMQGVQDHGWRYVAWVRMTPILPFNLVNYMLGLTSIGLGSYTWATALFIMPFSFGYTYCGTLGPKALETDVATFLKLAAVSVSVVMLLWLLTRILPSWLLLPKRGLDETL